ncbi:MAG: hypothetical protein HQK54_14560 [Oligoflexales bacterium]|nr:hypothetical protein [Oligoflexales bacterium]
MSEKNLYTLKIKGPNEELEKFKKNAGDSANEGTNYENYAPFQISNLLDRHHIKIETEENSCSWEVTNSDLCEISDQEIAYHFEASREIPIDILKAVSKEYPNCIFKCEIEDMYEPDHVIQNGIDKAV